MPAAPLPKSERRRLEALSALRVLDSEPERGFDELTELARSIFGMPIALVSLVDEDRQWFKSAAGLGVCETPRSQSVCGYVVLSEQPLVIEDLAGDERTSDNPLVTDDPKLRFYAGAPLTLSTGETIGSFCVIDTKPRAFSVDQVAQLERLASACVVLLETRRSAQLLVEADRRIQAIQEAAPVALLHLEPIIDERTRITDFRITEANISASRLFRTKESGLAGSTLLFRLPQLGKTDDGAVLRALKHAARSGDTESIECDYSDREVDVSLRWKIARADGRLIVSIEDISETRRHERELRARDELLRQFVQNTPAAVAMFDREMRYLVAADQWRRDYGLGEKDILGRSHYEIFPEIGEDWKLLHQRTLAGETITCERDRFDRADGSVQYLRYQLQPWRTGSGEIGGIVMFTEEITDRVERELDIERQQEIIEVAGRLSHVGGWSYDADTQKLTWTNQTRRIFGVPDIFEPTVENAIAFYPGESGERIAEVFGRALATGEPYDIELSVRTADGEIRLTRSIGQPVIRDGRVVRISGSVQDVTEEAEARQQTLRAKELLEQSEKTSKTGGWAYDVAKDSIYWTPHVYAIHEVGPDWSPDVSTGLDFYTDASKPVITAAFRRAVEDGLPFDVELEIVTGRGTVRPVRAVGNPVVEEGRVVRVAGSFQDLTDLRARQAEERRLMGLITSITDASSDVIFVKDPDGVVLFGNPAYAAALGCSLDELIGSCEYDRFDDEESVRLLKAADRSVIERGEPVRVEERICVPSTGETRTFSTEKHPYRLPDGSVGGVIGVCRDITALQNAMDAVRVSSLRLNFALSAANVGYWDHDLETDEVFYADTWYSMLGYEPGELPMTAESFWETLIHPDDREPARDRQDECLAGKADSIDSVIRLRNKSGAWQWILDIGRVIERDADGKPTRIVGVHVDINESKLSKDRLEMALVAANQGIWEWSIPDNSCYFDEMWYRLLGYKPGELPMSFETWETLCHPDDLPAAKRALGDYLQGESESYGYEHRLRSKDGQWKWVLGTGRITARDAEGKPTRVVGVNLDIDQRRHAAEALERALEEARSANAAKSQFLANMSHEIRTPMTAILGYAELMVHDDELTADQQRMKQTAGIIQRNGEHLLTIINDILDFSKIDAGKMTIETLPTDPLQLLAGVEELLRGRANAKGLRFEIQQRAALPETLVADPVRVRQILMNVIQNAIKFTESGGITVRVETVADESDPADADPSRLRISVIDTGIGISEENLAKLFSVFQQADGSMARRFGGTGLGLAISRHLAEAMGGGLTATSREGRGSTFVLELPLVPGEGARWMEPGGGACAWPQAVPDEAPVEREGISGARVLLVEDGPDNQRLISHHLKKAGAEVTLAVNGMEGVREVESANARGEPFDVVLMDMQMPVMDGYTATRALRERGVAVPIIALTAHAMSGDRQRCLDAGCDDYETKPVNRQKLIERCASLMRQARRAA